VKQYNFNIVAMTLWQPLFINSAL